MSRPLLALVEQPGGEHDEGGLDELRRLDRDEADLKPALGAFDLGPEPEDQRHQRDADDEDDQARAPDLLRRERRGREHDGDRGQEQSRLAAHEIERLEMVLGGDRRARRQRKHEARAHQQQQAEEHQPVDGEPPVREHAPVGAGEPHAAFPCSGVTLSAPSSAMTISRKASPRFSKLAN